MRTLLRIISPHQTSSTGLNSIIRKVLCLGADAAINQGLTTLWNENATEVFPRFASNGCINDRLR